MKKLSLAIFTAITILVSSGALVSAQVPSFCDTASPKPDICKEVNDGASGTNTDNPATRILRSAINVMSYIVGVASVIMIIVGGFKYVVSGGDANAIASAKNTIIFALVGLAVALLAQAIVRFVLNRI